jgi:hypothetical protein
VYRKEAVKKVDSKAEAEEKTDDTLQISNYNNRLYERSAFSNRFLTGKKLIL